MDILGQFDFPALSGTYGFRSTDLIRNSKCKPILEFRFDLKDVSTYRGDIKDERIPVDESTYRSKKRQLLYRVVMLGKSYPREYFAKFTPKLGISYLRATLHTCEIDWQDDYVGIDLDMTQVQTNIPLDYITNPRFCLTFQK